jgi:ABC-2 type transport system ATP-binding protein
VRVVFKEVVDTDWLSTMNSVTGVNFISSSAFNIQCTNAELVKKQILQLAIDKNLNIVSLQSENQSLENIFKTLTN